MGGAFANEPSNQVEFMHKARPLSTEQLHSMQTAIFDLLKTNEEALTAIQKIPGPLVDKWQRFLQLILPIQLQVLKTYGLDDTQLELSRFNEQYMQHSIENASLFELNKQKWLFLFEKAFGVTEFKETSLQEAQSLIADIVEEMTSEEFLKQVDDTMSSMAQDATLIQKRKALLSILFPLHMSVMAKHGFEGETGYIQAQRAIMDYYFDPQISQRAAYAQVVVFKRAQLI